jgi:hypothetical protein
MAASGLAVILIPLAGTICLAAWLTLVSCAGRHHPQRAGSSRAPGHDTPGMASAAGRRQQDARSADPGAWR